MALAKTGKKLILTPEPTGDVLENKVYNLEYDENNGVLFLTEQADFILPKKIYGNKFDKYFKYFDVSFKENSGNLGIMLYGLKGSGKTLLAKKYCMHTNKPVIVIDKPFNGGLLNKVIQNKSIQDVVFLFDEFDKVYCGRESSDAVKESLLGLLDGASTAKNTYIFTANEIYRVPDAFKNRPSRIRYSIEYPSLDKTIIDEVCDDQGVTDEQRKVIETAYINTSDMSYDMLLGIIKEVKLFNMSFEELVEIYNMSLSTPTFNMKVYTGDGENITPSIGMILDVNCSTDDGKFDIYDCTESMAMRMLRKSLEERNYSSLRYGHVFSMAEFEYNERTKLYTCRLNNSHTINQDGSSKCKDMDCTITLKVEKASPYRSQYVY